MQPIRDLETQIGTLEADIEISNGEQHQRVKGVKRRLLPDKEYVTPELDSKRIRLSELGEDADLAKKFRELAL